MPKHCRCVLKNDSHKRLTLSRFRFGRNLELLSNRPFSAGCCATALLCLCAIASGCNSRKPDPAAATTNVQPATEAGSDGRCRDLIQSVIDTFQLKVLGISSDLDTG